MTAPRRIRLSRAKGFRLPKGVINVARPGRHGNPFIVGQHGTRAQVVWRFAALAQGFINLGMKTPTPEVQMHCWSHMYAVAKTMRGHDVACWCSLDGPCHGDVLLHLWNGGHPDDLGRFHTDLPTPGLGMMATDLQASHIENQFKLDLADTS